MGVLDDVGTFMAANVSDTTLTLGTNLFLGRMPDTPDTASQSMRRQATPQTMYSEPTRHHQSRTPG